MTGSIRAIYSNFGLAVIARKVRSYRAKMPNSRAVFTASIHATSSQETITGRLVQRVIHEHVSPAPETRSSHTTWNSDSLLILCLEEVLIGSRTSVLIGSRTNPRPWLVWLSGDLRGGALLLEISQVLQDFVQDLNHWRGQGLVVLRRAFHPLHQKFDSYYLENTNTEGFTSQSKESSPLCIAHYDTWLVTSSSRWVQGSHAQRILQPVFWENILQTVIDVITKCDRSSYYKVRR